ncbi:MAG: hypothetical protein ACM3ZA_00690 [Bacillota bacterium]
MIDPLRTAAPDPLAWMADTIRGSAGGRGERPRLSADSARRLARTCWSELTNHDPNIFPVQTERRGIRFYLQEERGGQRLSALVWDGFQWRTVGSLRLPASD